MPGILSTCCTRPDLSVASLLWAYKVHRPSSATRQRRFNLESKRCPKRSISSPQISTHGRSPPLCHNATTEILRCRITGLCRRYTSLDEVGTRRVTCSKVHRSPRSLCGGDVE